MEIKTFNNIFEIKSSNQNGEFSGYASIFNYADSYGDIILPGAFRETLIENPCVQMLWQHDTKEPIGTFEFIEETLEGLYVKGKLLLDLTRAREAYALMREKIISGLSIGFEVNDFYYAKDKRYIRSVKLWEISLVTFPANSKALIDEVKTITSEFDDAIKKLSKLINNNEF